MDFIENVWVRDERAEAGLSAKVDPPAAVFGTREIDRIRVAKDAPAEGDEWKMFFLFLRKCLHQFCAGERSLRFLGFRNEDFKRIDC